MANMSFSYLLSLLSLVYLALAAPSSSVSSVEKRGSSNTVQFTINLTWEDYDAMGSGVRKAILTNGTIPGPPLTVKVGQDVEFMVHNNLPFGTSVHFHGIGQLNTPWADGVTGLTQRPIPAGSSYLYKWKADEAGSYFYHAHHKGQMMDGLYGAIMVVPDQSTERPFKLISGNQNDISQMTKADASYQPIFISDWSQYTFSDFFGIEQKANVDIACADSIIVNGKGSVYCQPRASIDSWTAPNLKKLLATVNPPQLTDKGCIPPDLKAVQGNFSVNIAAIPDNVFKTCTPSTGQTTAINVNKADGWAALTFINPGGFESLKFTIDNHKLWVYGVSGADVIPQQVDQVIVNNGDRYSVMVKLDQPVATYKINIANNGLNQIIGGYANLVYQGSSGLAANAVSVMNYAGINTTTIVPFRDAKAAPYQAIKPAATADLTFNFNIKKTTGPYLWTLSGVNSYDQSRDDQTPLLFQNPSTIPSSDLILKTGYDQWVDLIIQVQGPIAQPHPMHKHANKAFVLGGGSGKFNWSTVAEAAAALPAGTFNFDNPPYRDTYTTVPAEQNNAWMVLRYKADHPGVWIFHCHMQTHLSGGMAVVLIDAPDKIPTIPSEYEQGNGCPKGSPDYNPMTGSTAASGSGNGTYSPSSPNSSIAPFTGAASSVASSSFVIISALVAAVIGLSL